MFKKYAEAQILESRMGDHASLSRTAHRAVFEYEPKQGFLYVRSRAISSRTNDNFDHFPAEEIKAAWRTFIGKPVFVNHHNADHRRARGVIIDAALHEDVLPDGQPDTWVEVLMEVDAVRFPKLADAILRGEIERTSMGTDVAYSVCSVCANKATNPAQYCKHIPAMKGQKVRRKTASGDGTEDVLVYEKCYGLGFFENSLLVEDPADPTAYFLGVDDRGVGGGYRGDLAMVASKRTGSGAGEDAPRLIEWINDNGVRKAIIRYPDGRTVKTKTPPNNTIGLDREAVLHTASEIIPVSRIRAGNLAKATSKTAANYLGLTGDNPRNGISVDVYEPRSGKGWSVGTVAWNEHGLGTEVWHSGDIGLYFDTREEAEAYAPQAYVEHMKLMRNYQSRQASRRSLVCGRCRHQWDSRAQYNIACPKCGAEESVTVDTRRASKTASLQRTAGEVIPVSRIKPGDTVENLAGYGSKWVVTDVRPEGPQVRVFFGEKPSGLGFAPTDTLLVSDPAGRGLSDAEWDDRTPDYGPGKMSFRCPVCDKLINVTIGRPYPRHKPPSGGDWCEASGKSDAEVNEIVQRNLDAWRATQRNYSLSTTAAKDYPSVTHLQPGDRFEHERHGLCEVIEVRRARNNKGVQPYDSVKCRRLDKGDEMTIPMYSKPMKMASRRTASYEWYTTRQKAQTYPGLTETVIVHIAEVGEAEAEIVELPMGTAAWTVWVGDSIASEGESPSLAQAKTDAIHAAERAEESLGQQTMFGSKKTVCRHCDNEIVQDGQDWVMADPSGGDPAVCPYSPSEDWHGLHEPKVGASKLAFGETPAPPKVDTLRDENCPICGDAAGFNGGECRMCGYIQPPEQFMDPDLTKAQEVDLRQNIEDAAVGDDGITDVTDEAEEADVTHELGEVDQFTLTKPGDDPADPTLGETEHAQTEEEELADEPAVVEEEAEVDAEVSVSPESNDPSADAEDDEDEEDDADGEDRSNGPQFDLKKKVKRKQKREVGPDDAPFPRSKKKDARRRPARVIAHGEGEDVAMRPTLRIIAEQQAILEAQGKALNAVAARVGVDISPFQREAGQKIATLRKRADTENPGQPVPESDSESAETDVAETGEGSNDVESVGATSETDVSPDATADVQSVGGVTSEAEALDLSEQDVTKPVEGTTGPLPVDQVRGEADVEAKGLDSEQAFPIEDTSKTQTVGSSESRTFASLRLARLRIEAGIVDDADDITLAQRIEASNQSDDSISNEIETLSKVTAKRSATPAFDESRRLVPRAAARTTPSLAGGGGAPEGVGQVVAGMDTPSPEESLFE